MGFAQDKIGPRNAMVICAVIQGLSLIALPLLGTESLLFVFAIFFGVTYGGEAPQSSGLAAQYFGLASITTIYASISTVGNLPTPLTRSQ